MSIKEQFVSVLDRPGGRWALAALARLRTGMRVEYDGRWMRLLPDGLVLVDQVHFTYYSRKLLKSAEEVQLTESAARDYWFHDYSPKPGDTIVDIGAGTGIETRVFVEAVGAHGRVYAVEAHPDTYQRLQLAVQRNGWTNVTPVFAALIGEREGTVYIDDQPQDVSNAIALEAGDRFRHPVPGMSLDALCERYGIDRISFMKMNIEGAERLAIQGMKRCMSFIDRMCIACHDHRTARGDGDFFATETVVTEFLQRHGFTTNKREDHPQPFARGHVYAYRQADRD